MQAGVANELSKLYAATLGGFAPVALGMFPDAADRPHGAYQDLTPASLPDEAQEPVRWHPLSPPLHSALMLVEIPAIMLRRMLHCIAC